MKRLRELMWFVIGIAAGVAAITIYELFGRPVMPEPEQTPLHIPEPEEDVYIFDSDGNAIRTTYDY